MGVFLFLPGRRPGYHRPMFFALSKILWFVANPGNLLLIGLAAGGLLLATRWRRGGLRLLALVAAAAFLIAVVPVGDWLMRGLENRFPAVASSPARVDGIVVAGGIVDPLLSEDRGQAAVNGAVERLFAAANLAKRHPRAKLIFTGGAGRLLHPESREARLVAPLLAELGIAPERVVLDEQSRNTWENAVNSRRLASPKSGETWLLVTSAFHMPRAIGCFRRAGWTDIVPYPVDYHTTRESLSSLAFDFTSGLSGLNAAVHEYLGLLFYWATGKTDALLPGPG